MEALVEPFPRSVRLRKMDVSMDGGRWIFPTIPGSKHERVKQQFSCSILGDIFCTYLGPSGRYLHETGDGIQRQES